MPPHSFSFYHIFLLFAKFPTASLLGIFLTLKVNFEVNSNPFIDFSTSFYLLFDLIHLKLPKKSPISTKLSTMTYMSFSGDSHSFLSKKECHFRFFLSFFVLVCPFPTPIVMKNVNIYCIMAVQQSIDYVLFCILRL